MNGFVAGDSWKNLPSLSSIFLHALIFFLVIKLGETADVLSVPLAVIVWTVLFAFTRSLVFPLGGDPPDCCDGLFFPGNHFSLLC